MAISGAKSGSRRRARGAYGRLSADVPELKRDGFQRPFFKRRAALYVDGFNLFHALKDMGVPELRWLDLQSLARQLAPRGQKVARVTWASAMRPTSPEQQERHQTYRRALEATGVRALMGHYVVHPETCEACGHEWSVATEKQGDVNLALAMIDDAWLNCYDVAYLMTSDGDHAATMRYLKERFPEKELVLVSPPGRYHNKALLSWADYQAHTEVEMLVNSQLPDQVRTIGGIVDRPEGWNMDLPTLVEKGHLKLVVSNG